MRSSGRAGKSTPREPSVAPISSAQLERYRLGLRQTSRAQLTGAHLVRRRGQSLEFRDFRPYTAGDDIRHVDWRASARHGRAHEYVVRTFELEAQSRIVISVDTRASMRLPVDAPKLTMACWLAETIAYVAGRSGDLVALHDLFGAPATSIADLGRAADRSRIRRALARLTIARPAAPLSLAPLGRVLPPAAIWLLVTDLYFDRDADVDRLVARMLDAQRGARWVVVLELDSWPYEKRQLGAGLRRIEGPGRERQPPRLDVTDGALRIVEERLDARRRRCDRAQAGGYSHVRWSWPADAPRAMETMFRHAFFADPVVRRLVMKDRAS
jgi:uncharacterized protein (DUF58 family)